MNQSAPQVPPLAEVKPPRRSWWSRNWKWAVPVGCLTPIVLCGGGIALVVAIIFGSIKSSDAYTKSLELVRADSRVQQALGTPIEPGMMVTGSINVSGTSGDADLAYPVRGPNGAATVNVVATKQGGTWTFQTIRVDVEGTGRSIDLLDKAADEQ